MEIDKKEEKKEDKKGMLYEKFAWHKDHHKLMPFGGLILLIIVFCIGLAIGHGFGREGRGRFGFGGNSYGGCMGRGFFQNERGYRGNGSEDFLYNRGGNFKGRSFRNQFWNNSGAENSATTTVDQNASSTPIN
jgi:hypothetical protein